MLPKLSEIAFRRRMLGLTQKQLALEVGISQSAIAKIERKKMVPNYVTAKRIFETLEHLSKCSEKTAKDIMRKKVFFVAPEDSLEKAAAILIKHGFSNLPVIDGRKVVGRINEGKILEAGRDNYRAECSRFMAPPPVTVSEDTPASVVKDILKKESIVLVQGTGGAVRGIISRSDVL